jgi:hypothetical protein
VKSSDIIKALRKRHGTNGREWAFFDELRAGTGYKSYKTYKRTGLNPEQRFDAWAINLYPSKKHLTIAYEVKVSRSDFLNEIKNPHKRDMAMMYSNEFYFATPKGLVSKEEIPSGCGLIEIADDLSSKVILKAEHRPQAELNWNFVASIARRSCK